MRLNIARSNAIDEIKTSADAHLSCSFKHSAVVNTLAIAIAHNAKIMPANPFALALISRGSSAIWFIVKTDNKIVIKPHSTRTRLNLMPCHTKIAFVAASF